MRASISVIAAAIALVAAPRAFAQFDIPWHTIDGGGGVCSAGNFTVMGTIGQPDAGVVSGGNFTIESGFWPGVLALQQTPATPGDMNCDGVVTVGDIGGFVLALTNPAQYAATYPECDINNADINNDGNVTVGDIGPFVQLLTGS